MAEIKQSEEDLKSQLRDQMQLLINSCRLYDDGCKIESKNIAIRLRVLLYDTKQSTSLLTLLKSKDILFYDSTFNEGLLSPFMSFIVIQLRGKETEYFPILDKFPHKDKKITFDEWWNKAIIKGPFTRGDLILAVAHKDGGAHVDLKLDKKYVDLTKNNSMGWESYGDNGEIIPPNPGIESACLRQMAYEVIKTLNIEFPEIFADLKMLLK